MSTIKAVRKADPNDSSKPVLWTARICPFAERVRLAFCDLGLEYDGREIVLYSGDKPEAFLKANPRGLVPALEDNGYAIYESSICLEYIDETWHVPGKPGLFPSNPGDRAIARIWSDFISKNFVPPFYNMLLKQDKSQQEEAKSKLLKAIKTLNDAMVSISPNGQFFMGDNFGFVDVMLAPHVERFVMLNHYRQFSVPEDDEFKRFHTWWTAVQKHWSYQATKLSDEELITGYRHYADNTAPSKLANALRKGETVP